MSKINLEQQFLKLRGKYFNNSITHQELKRFNELALTRNEHVSLREFGNRFRNYQESLPGEDNTKTINGALYNEFGS